MAEEALQSRETQGEGVEGGDRTQEKRLPGLPFQPHAFEEQQTEGTCGTVKWFTRSDTDGEATMCLVLGGTSAISLRMDRPGPASWTSRSAIRGNNKAC